MPRGDSAVTAGAGEPGSQQALRMHNWVRAGRSFSGGERHCFFRNRGDGGFEDLSAVSGLDKADDGRAAAFTDWDKDGDLDLWIANRSAPQLRYLENGAASGGRSLSLQLVGETANRDAIGARAVLDTGGDAPPQTRVVTAGSGFLAQSSKVLHFGLGEAESASVVIHWPGGSAERFPDLRAGGRYRIVEGGEAAELTRDPRPPLAPRAAEAEPPTEQARVFSATRIPLPKLSYLDASGEAQEIPATPERPILINLWASWCKPCAAELADFAAAAGRFDEAGLDILALNVDAEADLEKSKQLLESVDFPHPHGRAPQRMTELLQLVNNRLFDRHRELPLPSSFLIDRGGRLAAIYKGVTDASILLADTSKLSLEGSGLREASLPFPGRWVSKGLPEFRHFTLAIDLVEEGFLPEAAEYVERHREALEADPEFGVLLASLGNAHVARGDAELALQFYRDAIAHDPELAAAHLNLGITLNRLGEGGPAEAALRKALDLEPQSALGHRELADNLANRGRRPEAIPLFRRALELNPDDLAASVQLARALTPDEPAEALRIIEAANAATGGERPQILAALANAQRANGDLPAARQSMEKAIGAAEQQGLEALAEKLRTGLARWGERQ